MLVAIDIFYIYHVLIVLLCCLLTLGKAKNGTENKKNYYCLKPTLNFVILKNLTYALNLKLTFLYNNH